MTPATVGLPLHAADTLATDLSDQLAVPPPLDSCHDESPSSPRWRHQALSKGAAGVAILHAVRARNADAGDERVHAWLTRAVCEGLSVGPGAGLWFGAHHCPSSTWSAASPGSARTCCTATRTAS